MHVSVKSYYGNTMPDYVITDITDFCKKAEQEASQHAHENMSTVDWQNKTNTLLYTLLIEGRYDVGRGRFFLGYVDGVLAGVSGCYTYDEDPDILVCGVRCWTLPEYRVKYLHGNNIFPAQFAWGKQNNYKAGMFTFNEYNIPLLKFLKRITSGKMTAPGLPNSDIYKDLTFSKNPINIKNVDQWIAMKTF